MIKQFTLDHQKKQLIIDWLNSNKPSQLSYEYLRVSAEQVKETPVSHKKQVKLLWVEPVGKHGFRFHFDDGFSIIYAIAFLQELVKSYPQRWPQYLAKLKQSGHSRETMIDIKQL